MISNNLLLGNFVVKGFKMISFLLDHAVYWLAAVVYKAFYYLANATLLNDAIIENFTRRIYAIIGILMIFVLAFNLLNYIVDPDKMNDKKTGASAIIKDIVIALVILTLLPTIFTKLYSLQSQILSSGVIENLILGGYSEETAASYEDYMNSQGEYSSLTDYYINNGANMMIANVFIAFLTPIDNFSVLDCGTDTEHEDYCNAYQEVKETGDIDAFGDLYLRDDYSYMPFLSTVGGVVLLFFMLSFCLNLGKRAGKMALLQLIAPIPVVMEILPTKKGSRKTWLDMLIKSFLEVFLFLIVIYVVIFLISLIPDVIVSLFGNGGNFGLVKIITLIMLIFGLLQFGKEAPQMIFDILGIKSTGVIKAAAQRAVAMGGVAGGLLGSTAGRFSRNFNATDGNIGQKLASGFAGAASGFGRTLWGARNVHNLKDAKALRTNVNQQTTMARINGSNYRMQHGNTTAGVISGRVGDFKSGTRDRLESYFKGDTFSNYSSSLKSLGEVKGILDKRKKLDNDAKYNSSKSNLTTRKTEKYYQEYEKFLNQYSTLKAGYAGSKYDFDTLGITNNEEGFLKYMTDSSSAGASYYSGEFSDIKAAYNEMNEARRDFNTKQIDNDINVAVEMLGLANRNYDLRNLTDSSGLNLIDSLNSVIDNQGNIKTGHSIDEVRQVLKDIDTAQKGKTTEYTRKTIYEEQQRKNKQSSNDKNKS